MQHVDIDAASNLMQLFTYTGLYWTKTKKQQLGSQAAGWSQTMPSPDIDELGYPLVI